MAAAFLLSPLQVHPAKHTLETRRHTACIHRHGEHADMAGHTDRHRQIAVFNSAHAQDWHKISTASQAPFLLFSWQRQHTSAGTRSALSVLTAHTHISSSLCTVTANPTALLRFPALSGAQQAFTPLLVQLEVCRQMSGTPAWGDADTRFPSSWHHAPTGLGSTHFLSQWFRH